jgi:hypothetical protein
MRGSEPTRTPACARTRCEKWSSAAMSALALASRFRVCWWWMTPQHSASSRIIISRSHDRRICSRSHHTFFAAASRRTNCAAKGRMHATEVATTAFETMKRNAMGLSQASGPCTVATCTVAKCAAGRRMRRMRHNGECARQGRWAASGHPSPAPHLVHPLILRRHGGHFLGPLQAQLLLQPQLPQIPANQGRETIRKDTQSRTHRAGAYLQLRQYSRRRMSHVWNGWAT